MKATAAKKTTGKTDSSAAKKATSAASTKKTSKTMADAVGTSVKEKGLAAKERAKAKAGVAQSTAPTSVKEKGLAAKERAKAKASAQKKG